LVPILLAVVLAALLGTSAVLHSQEGRDVDPGMLVAARTQATNFFSLDYRHANADVDRILALATDPLKKDYASRRQEVVDGVTQKKLVVTATIPRDGAAVELSDGNHGQVLVAVDVSTGTVGGATTTNRYRTRILLTRVNGRWLVSDVKQVG
jgi:Mce-associated membrane protein